MELIDQMLMFARKHPVLLLAWATVFVAVIYLTIKIKLSKVRVVNNAEAINLLNKQAAIIIDIRSSHSFKLGHITDAYNILPIDIKNNSVKSIEKFKERPVIVVCENGVSALASAEILITIGFTSVHYLKEGIAGWNAEHLPLVKN